MQEKKRRKNNMNQFIKQANRSKLCSAGGEGGWLGRGSECKNRTINDHESEKMKQFK